MSDLPQEVSSDLLLVANVVKLPMEVCNQDDKPALGEYLNRLYSLVDNNGLTFNTTKCKLVHLRHVSDYVYNLGNSVVVLFLNHTIDHDEHTITGNIYIRHLTPRGGQGWWRREQ